MRNDLLSHVGTGSRKSNRTNNRAGSLSVTVISTSRAHFVVVERLDVVGADQVGGHAAGVEAVPLMFATIDVGESILPHPTVHDLVVSLGIGRAEIIANAGDQRNVIVRR